MQKIKKLACFVLNYGVLAWMAAIVVWYLIVCTLKNGISCDEPNWNAIAKRYQRKRDIVYKINSRKKRSVSSRKNPKHSFV